MESGINNTRLLNFRPLFAAAVGFVCGIHFGVSCGFGGALPSGAALLFALGLPLLMFAAAITGAVRRYDWLFVIAVFFLAGILRVQLFSPYSDVSLAKEAGGEYAVMGTVADLDKSEVYTNLKLVNATVEGEEANHAILLRVKNENAEGVSVGDNMSAVCSSVSIPQTVYGSYNERLQRLAAGVSLVAYSADVSVVSRGNAKLARAFAGARSRLARVIDSTFGDKAPLVKAFLIGEKDDVPDEVYSAYVTGGIAHLLTLSGFHVGILTALLYFALPRRRPLLRFIIVAVVLLLYCAVTGFSPSLVRASIMCVCALAAPTLGRRADPLSSLSLAALVILAFNPFKLYSAGFLLSFAATLGILFITSFAVRGRRGRIFGRLGEYALITVGASAATVLISAAIFGRVYPYNVLANIVCVPLLSLAITASFILTALAFMLPGFCSLAAALPNALLGLVQWLLDKLSLLPGACVYAARPSVLSCVLALVCLFSVSAYVLRPLKTRLKFGGVSLLLFTASIFADIIPV